MQAVSRPERRTPPPEGVHVRIGAAQERRETRVSSEDPRAGVRALQSQPGAGGRCARTRQAQTVAERLRREGAQVHEDTRLEIGPARPLANLRHVMCECEGTPGRTRRLEGITVALDAAIKAVPQGSGAAYHQVTRAARAALEASDSTVLTDAQWQHVDDVLAAFLPDFGRADQESQRGDMIKEVVACLQAVHGRAAGAVEEWQRTHRRALERRREQERYRGLLRTVVRAWREEADGRKAMSLRVALPRGVNVQAGAHRAGWTRTCCRRCARR